MDGNSPLCKCLIQDTHQPADSPPCDWIPAVHAGMTGYVTLVYNDPVQPTARKEPE